MNFIFITPTCNVQHGKWTHADRKQEKMKEICLDRTFASQPIRILTSPPQCTRHEQPHFQTELTKMLSCCLVYTPNQKWCSAFGHIPEVKRVQKSWQKIWIKRKGKSRNRWTITRKQTNYKHCIWIKDHITFKMTAGGNMLPSARQAKTIVAWQFSISERLTRSWRFAIVLEPNQQRNLWHTHIFLTNSHYGMTKICYNSAED